jgi:hypothetical protein
MPSFISKTDLPAIEDSMLKLNANPILGDWCQPNWSPEKTQRQSTSKSFDGRVHLRKELSYGLDVVCARSAWRSIEHKFNWPVARCDAAQP